MVRRNGPNFATLVRLSWPFRRGSTVHVILIFLSESFMFCFLYVDSSSGLSELSDVTSITLALRTLGSFDFEGKADVNLLRTGDT